MKTTYDADSLTDTDIPMKNCTRLVILGAPKVGKTCVSNWLLSKPFEDYYIPTIENFHKKIFRIRGEIYSLEILDTSGNDPFPAMRKLNIMTGDLFVLVFSLTTSSSWIQVKQLCEEIKELKKSKSNEKHSSVLLLGNKLDQVTENRNKKTTVQHRCVDPIDAQNFASGFKSCFYSEISCKTLWGITNAFQSFLESSVLPVEILPSKHRRLSFDTSFERPKTRAGYKVRLVNGQIAHQSQIVNNEAGSDTELNKPNQYNNNINNSSNNNANSPIEHSNNSFKKSFKKMAFRRQLGEACGKVLVNSRRPSIRSEMKLYEIKSDKKSMCRQYSLRNRRDIKSDDQYKNTRLRDFCFRFMRIFQKTK